MNVHAPIKLTDRQEQFCQQILSGRSQAEAYRIAYNASQKASEAHGSRLVASGRVQARLEQLRADEAAAQRVTLPFLTRGLLAAAALARETAQASAMAQAYMGVAKLHGFLIDRTQVDMVLRRPSAEPQSPDEMSEDEWLSRHALTLAPANTTSDTATPSRSPDDVMQPVGGTQVYPSIDLQPGSEPQYSDSIDQGPDSID